MDHVECIGNEQCFKQAFCVEIACGSSNKKRKELHNNRQEICKILHVESKFNFTTQKKVRKINGHFRYCFIFKQLGWKPSVLPSSSWLSSPVVVIVVDGTFPVDRIFPPRLSMPVRPTLMSALVVLRGSPQRYRPACSAERCAMDPWVHGFVVLFGKLKTLRWNWILYLSPILNTYMPIEKFDHRSSSSLVPIQIHSQ